MASANYKPITITEDHGVKSVNGIELEWRQECAIMAYDHAIDHIAHRYSKMPKTDENAMRYMAEVSNAYNELANQLSHRARKDVAANILAAAGGVPGHNLH